MRKKLAEVRKREGENRKNERRRERVGRKSENQDGERCRIESR